MPLFELDDGRPRLVQPMQPLPGSFAQDLALLLTHHLAAIAGEPLFPVRHRSGAPDHADLPELLALDATGRAVVVEAVQVLDDDAVVAALRHAGAAARMTATDLARSYHADPDRFAVDFAAFRDQVAFGMTTSRREGVRLVVVCSEVATEAGDTLGYLRGPGRHVDVLQLGVVRGVDDRRFLDVSPLARHENVRRPVEPTALRLVRSSEASFATAMAYDEGRRRPPAPLGDTGHAGSSHAPGLPSTSAFPSGPGQTNAPRRSSPPAAQRPGTGRPTPSTPRSTPAVPPPPPAARSTSAPASPGGVGLPVAGGPTTQAAASTRSVPVVGPGHAAGARPPAYAPPTNRTTASYVPPANPLPAPSLTDPLQAPPASGPAGLRGAYGAPSSPSRAAPWPTPQASRTTSTAPTPAAQTSAASRPAAPLAHTGLEDAPASASPVYEAMSGLLGAPEPQPHADPPRPATSVPSPPEPTPVRRRRDSPYPELATLAKQRRALVTLVWLRERRGQRLVAVLTPDGSIELPDGTRFVEPGDAAAYAAGTPVEVDGWRAWRLGDGGPTLAEAAGRHEE